MGNTDLDFEHLNPDFPIEREIQKTFYTICRKECNLIIYVLVRVMGDSLYSFISNSDKFHITKARKPPHDTDGQVTASKQ